MVALSIFVNSQPVINPSIEGAKAGVEDFITEVKAIYDMHLGLLDLTILKDVCLRLQNGHKR